MGRNIKPCGTPDVTDNSPEQSPSSTTVWDIPIKKDEMQFEVTYLIKY